MSGEEKPKRRGRPPGSGRKREKTKTSGQDQPASAAPVQGELFNLEKHAPQSAGTRRSAKTKRTGGATSRATPKQIKDETIARPAAKSATGRDVPILEHRREAAGEVGLASRPQGPAGWIPRRWSNRLRVGLWLAMIGYAAAVLFVDAMASMGDDSVIYWSRFHWTLGDLARRFALGPPWNWRVLSMFDLYKVLFWLLIPLAWSLPRLEGSWFSWRRMEKKDALLLAGFCALGLVGVMATRFIPSLEAIYPRGQFGGLSDRMLWLGMMGCWWLSWLPGWEFLHRYVLVRAATRLFPKWGWILVPVSETAYHLVKPWQETLGMAVFSVLATRYVMTRRSLVAPFLAHFAIEAALVLLMLM